MNYPVEFFHAASVASEIEELVHELGSSMRGTTSSNRLGV